MKRSKEPPGPGDLLEATMTGLVGGSVVKRGEVYSLISAAAAGHRNGTYRLRQRGEDRDITCGSWALKHKFRRLA